MSNIIQGSAEWKAARCGSVTASRVADIVAKTKTGVSASRATYMAQLIVERLTGQVAESYTNAAMEWGTQTEPQARSAYEWHAGVVVAEIGLVAHPAINQCSASPDGLVGADGLVEIKCPNSATHIETLIEGKVPAKYVTQTQFQMACTGRQWCDYVSFDPRVPEPMQLFVQRVMRDDVLIAELEKVVRVFLAELAGKVETLQTKYQIEAAA